MRWGHKGKGTVFSHGGGGDAKARAVLLPYNGVKGQGKAVGRHKAKGSALYLPLQVGDRRAGVARHLEEPAERRQGERQCRASKNGHRKAGKRQEKAVERQ